MRSTNQLPVLDSPYPISKKETHQEFLPFMRSRLNVIGTAVVLLEDTITDENTTQKRHIEKIKDELDVLREMLNAQ